MVLNKTPGNTVATVGETGRVRQNLAERGALVTTPTNSAASVGRSRENLKHAGRK